MFSRKACETARNKTQLVKGGTFEKTDQLFDSPQQARENCFNPSWKKREVSFILCLFPQLVSSSFVVAVVVLIDLCLYSQVIVLEEERLLWWGCGCGDDAGEGRGGQEQSTSI